jgi:hypothetical protein
MPPRISTSAPRRLELFPITKSKSLSPVPQRQSWPSWLALLLTITGLAFTTVALHRELRLQACPVIVHG